MKHTIVLAAAVLFAVSSPVAALAAGLGVNANVHAAVNAGGAQSSVKAATHANAAASTPSYGTVVSAIAAGKDQSLPANITDVKIVALTSLKGNAATHAKALAQLTKKRASSLAALDAAVAADATLMTKLTAAGYTSDQVVAVTTTTRGTVTLYVNA